MNVNVKHFLVGAAIGTVLFGLPSLWLFNKAENSKHEVAAWKTDCGAQGGTLLVTSGGYVCARVSGIIFEVK
jgi:hypothetical protein